MTPNASFEGELLTFIDFNRGHVRTLSQDGQRPELST